MKHRDKNKVDIILVGGGGHCRSCIDVIELADQFSIKGVILPVHSAVSDILGYRAIGSDSEIPKLAADGNYFFICIGQVKSPEPRIRIYDLIQEFDGRLATVVSPTAHLSIHAKIGAGTIVMHGALINAASSIGENCIINSQALVEHDVKISDHCHISTGAKVNGGVSIGRGCFIGSGAIIREGVSIGDYSVIGAGQIVLNNLPKRAVFKGRKR